MLYLRSLLYCLLVFIGTQAGIGSLSSTPLHAQTDPWPFVGFDPAYPRLTHHTAELPTLKHNVQHDPLKRYIFGKVCSSLRDTIYFGTNNDVQKRYAAMAAHNVTLCLLLDSYINPNNAQFVSPLPDSLRQALLFQAEKAFATLNATVPDIVGVNFGNFDKWQWPAKMLLHYAAAHDMLVSMSAPPSVLATARASLLAFTQHYWLRATEPAIGTANFFDLILNNHALMTASALGNAALVLADSVPAVGSLEAQIMQRVLPVCHNILWSGTKPMTLLDSLGGFAEGPHYLRYSLQHLLLFYRALNFTVPDQSVSISYKGRPYSIRHPFHDPQYHYLYEWALAVMTPKAKLPPLEDSFVNLGFPELAFAEIPRYHVHTYAYDSSQASALEMNSELVGNHDLRADYLCTTTPVQKLGAQPKLQVMPAAGNAVFRSGDSLNATFLCAIAEHGYARANGAGHDQGDVGSFHLEYQNTTLAFDPGYVQWSERWRVNDGPHHNLILVNGCGPQGSTGSASRDFDGYLFPLHDLEGLRAIEMQTAYCNANITRRIYWLEDNAFVVRDLCTASGGATFTFQLHGNGLRGDTTGLADCVVDTIGGAARWQSPHAGLAALTIADAQAMTYTTRTSTHETGYLQWADHTAYIATSDRAINTQLTSVLMPYKGANAPTISALPALPNGLSGLRMGTDRWLFSSKNGFPTVVQPSQTGLPAEFATDARWTYFHLNSNGGLQYVWLEGGRLLRLAGRPLVDLNVPRSFLLYRTAPGHYEGWVSDSATVTIGLPYLLVSAGGDHLLSAVYNPIAQTATLRFEKASKFVLLLDESVVLSLPSDLAQSQAPVLYPNPTSDKVFVRFPDASLSPKRLSINLVDVAGRVVLANTQLGAYSDGFVFSVADLPSGVYFAQLSSESGATTTHRVVVFR